MSTFRPCEAGKRCTIGYANSIPEFAISCKLAVNAGYITFFSFIFFISFSFSLFSFSY